MKRLSIFALILIVSLGCETGNSTKSGISSKINRDTVNLYGDDLINYIYSHKDSVLNASDCMKFNGQNWANMYGDIIYHIAPATAMATSIDSCRTVKSGVESGQSLENMSRQAIKQGWLNGIVKVNITQENYITAQQQEQIDKERISNMTWEECNNRFSNYSSQELFSLAMDELQKGSDIENSESVRYKHKLETWIAVQCRKVLYNE